MKIESITLREIRMRLKSPFETSFGTVQDRRIVLVEVVADGASGWGNRAGSSPGAGCGAKYVSGPIGAS